MRVTSTGQELYRESDFQRVKSVGKVGEKVVKNPKFNGSTDGSDKGFEGGSEGFPKAFSVVFRKNKIKASEKKQKINCTMVGSNSGCPGDCPRLYH